MNNSITPAEIILVANKIVLFMKTRDAKFIDGIFVPDSVQMIDSFFPYVFQGQNAVTEWANGFISHAKNLTELRHSFGEP